MRSALAASIAFVCGVCVPGSARVDAVPPLPPCPFPSFAPPGPRLDPWGGRPFVLDVDGDGRLDLLFHDRTGGRLAVRRSLEGGEFAAPVESHTPAGTALLTWADFDGDGHLDVALGRPSGSTDPGSIAVLVLSGDGSGAFSAAPVETPLPLPIHGCLPGDFDRDTLADVVAVVDAPAGGGKKAVQLLRGDGRGAFVPAEVGPTIGAWGSVQASGDLDGSGTLDLVTTERFYRGGDVSVLSGDGEGGFSPPRRIAPGDTARLGDFNGDGRTDLAAVQSWFYYDGYVSVLLGDGHGGFVKSFGTPLGDWGYGSSYLALADFDADGRLDMAVQRADDRYYLIYPGDGAGGFGTPVRFGSLDLIGDFDGDNRPDILVSTSDGGTSLRTNNCGEGTVEETLVVPAFFNVRGQAGSLYSTSLSLANHGETAVLVDAEYIPSFGGGAVPGRITLGAWEHLSEERLSSSDFPFPAWGRSTGGLFRLHVTGASAPGVVSLLARTRTPGAGGKVGVAYSSVSGPEAFRDAATIAWLRETTSDRTNLALLHAGGSEEGDLVLSVTVVSTDPAHPGEATLPDVRLSPGGWSQLDRVLTLTGLGASSGFARVARVSGAAPWWSYAVVNDNFNSDGSFEAGVAEGTRVGQRRLVLPVLVENGVFGSELVVTNVSSTPKRLRCRFVADAVEALDRTVRFILDVPARGQVRYERFVQALRDLGLGSLVPAGRDYAGTLFVEAVEGDVEGLLIGARTSSAAPAGRIGVYYDAAPESDLATAEAWLPGLRGSGWTVTGERTNLAIVNAGDALQGASSFRVEMLNERTSQTIATFDVRVEPGRWMQLNNIVATRYASPLARVTRLSGTAPFLAYAVVNDGEWPGKGSGDGAFLRMRVPARLSEP